MRSIEVSTVVVESRYRCRGGPARRRTRGIDPPIWRLGAPSTQVHWHSTLNNNSYMRRWSIVSCLVTRCLLTCYWLLRLFVWKALPIIWLSTVNSCYTSSLTAFAERHIICNGESTDPQNKTYGISRVTFTIDHSLLIPFIIIPYLIITSKTRITSTRIAFSLLSSNF